MSTAQDLVALAGQDRSERCAELAEPDDCDPHQLPPASAVTSRCQPNRRSNARKSGFGSTAEVRLLHVAIAHVVADSIREDVVDMELS